jgi:hypothetical protein
MLSQMEGEQQSKLSWQSLAALVPGGAQAQVPFVQ